MADLDEEGGEQRLVVRQGDGLARVWGARHEQGHREVQHLVIFSSKALSEF